MEIIIVLLIGLALGSLLSYFYFKQKNGGHSAAAYKESEIKLIQLQSQLDSSKELFSSQLNDKNVQLEQCKQEVTALQNLLSQQERKLAQTEVTQTMLAQNNDRYKQEIEQLNERYQKEFELIANRILESKTEKFTALNKTNLREILDPLGKYIVEFKTKIEEVYNNESKERFSLGNEVKKLADLNLKMSEEAKNLTNALKGEAKTQGRWGEMILESILEKSGLVKGREYFMEHQLLDAQGKALISESEGKKMRPDAVIKYPDERSVIIDSKVSLNAFTRYLATDEIEEQNKELKAHVDAIKTHISTLSERGYDDYQLALDFVMLFVPSEAAYVAALKAEPDLWNYAYDKRILLLSPTNLITSLKLIHDLWKREYQNKNAYEIAERGAKLHDKFVGFIENLEQVGSFLDKAKERYTDAHKQLTTGNDNIVKQIATIQKLGIKNKKTIPNHLMSDADSETEVQ
jgi:DNA recombination protein RmuC